MLKKPYQSIVFGALLSLTTALPAYAVPIEQVSLTNNSTMAANSGSPDGNTQGSTLWQLYQQVQQLQQEIRELRGQLEDQQDVVDRTQKDLKNRYTDLDQRLEQLSQNGSQEPSATDAPTDTPVASSDDAATDTASSEQAAPKPVIAAPKPVNNPVTPAPSNPLSDSSDQNDQPDRQAYVAAYEIYKEGGAASAIAPMQQYINTYPNSVFVPNAYYWLGEFYLASNPVSFDKAKQNFSIVVSKYPKSAKAASALYRLATITHEVDHRPQDALTLMKKLVRDYPNTRESTYAQAFVKSHTN